MSEFYFERNYNVRIHLKVSFSLLNRTILCYFHPRRRKLSNNQSKFPHLSARGEKTHSQILCNTRFEKTYSQRTCMFTKGRHKDLVIFFQYFFRTPLFAQLPETLPKFILIKVRNYWVGMFLLSLYFHPKKSNEI